MSNRFHTGSRRDRFSPVRVQSTHIPVHRVATGEPDAQIHGLRTGGAHTRHSADRQPSRRRSTPAWSLPSDRYISRQVSLRWRLRRTRVLGQGSMCGRCGRGRPLQSGQPADRPPGWSTEPGIPPGQRNATLDQDRVQAETFAGYENRWNLLKSPASQAKVRRQIAATVASARAATTPPIVMPSVRERGSARADARRGPSWSSPTRRSPRPRWPSGPVMISPWD